MANMKTQQEAAPPRPSAPTPAKLPAKPGEQSAPVVANEKKDKTKKRFWWLKLRDTFFDDVKIKKLRRLAGGDTFTIIYLKMQLLSLRNGGVLVYESVEDSFVEELALTLDEAPENVQLALAYLERQKRIERINDTDYMLPAAVENIGSETDAAERMRNMRGRQAGALPGNNQP